MNIVIDSNIWISGIFWNGKPKYLLKILEKDILSSYICKEMIDEIDEVIKRDFFKERINLLGLTTENIINQIIELNKIIEIDGNLNAIKDDPDDNIILETAIKSKSEFLISGDNHLLDLKNYNNIKIISCKDFIDMLESNIM